MNRKTATWIGLISVMGGLTAAGYMLNPQATAQQSAPAAQSARGTVFNDINVNGQHDTDEPTLPGIGVSNGRQITHTDSAGRYELPIDDDDIIFVIKPRGWRTPLNENNLPRFYYIHKPNGSPADFQYEGVAPTGHLPDSIDFPLIAQQEPEGFQVVLFGDPQPRDQKEIDYVAHDVVEGLIGSDAAFGVTLGDIMFDNLSLFESEARTVGLIGIPWYNIVGNHDINFDAPNEALSNETFQKNFGPSYYSFDYGPAHFVVLDNVEWYVENPNQRGNYRGGLGSEQIAFLAEDLANVPDEKMVVLMMHMPLTDVRDRQDVYRLIENRPFCISIAGHTHNHEHRFITSEDGWRGPQPHHHIINVTVCGSWWSGPPDERGLPPATMSDGAPNGYSVLSLQGTEYKLDYHAAGRDADYQMQITAPPQATSADSVSTDVYVNFFNGSPKDTVEMRIASLPNNAWSPMQHSVERDPAYVAAYNLDRAINTDQRWIPVATPRNSTHLWKSKLPANLPTGTHQIEIRAIDLWNRTFHANRIIRITEN